MKSYAVDTSVHFADSTTEDKKRKGPKRRME